MNHLDLCNKPHIILGNELLLSKEIIDALNRGDALTIDGTRYILVEFFPEEEFGMMREGLHRVCYRYIPILAHRKVPLPDQASLAGRRADSNGSICSN